jgi:DNA polymerase-3 subunit delta'
MMSLRPLFGHHALRRRLADATRDGRLPASLLLTGPRGVGKQRLALWLGQRLLCERATDEPCGTCPQCRAALRLQHPDLHWYFPRAKAKDEGSDPSVEEVREFTAEAIEARLAKHGLWGGSSGMEALHLATVKALVRSASVRPAMASRTVFVVGDAERMVAQEGADQAANAFLKLLEEPPARTHLILTSSEPGALLPTIRSRVVTIRVAPLPADDVRAFLSDDGVLERLRSTSGDEAALIARAAGAPGRLFDAAASAEAIDAARRLLEAALAPRSPEGDALRAKVAASTGVARARGAYSDALDALTVLLHERVRAAVTRGLDRHARRVADGIAVLERTKRRTQQNVTPQLLTTVLLDELADLMARPA